MTYKQLYDATIGSGKYPSRRAKIKALAQFIFADKRNIAETKDDAVWEALERYEEMTGFFYDPTQEEFDDIVASII